MNILKTFNLSYSTYHMYKESQLQFYYYKIAKIKPVDWVPYGYGFLGNVLHDIMENTILDNNFNADNFYIEKWYSGKVDSLKGLFNTKFKQSTYTPMINIGIKYVKEVLSTYDEVIPEKRFDFDFHGIHIKGFIDVTAKKNGEVFLFDWKSDSSNTQEKHYLQRIFYAWAYHKVYDIIPKKCTWIYLRKLDKHSDSFTIDDLNKFELELIKDIDNIKAKGTDINNYEIGDYNSPFNDWKSLCLKEKERRNKKLKYGIAIWGNSSQLVGDISSLLKQGLVKKLSYQKADPKFIAGNWDGIMRLYETGSNRFPTGLTGDVVQVLKEYSQYMKVPYSLEYKEMRRFTGHIDVPKELVGVKLRDYQVEAVESFMKAKYSIVRMPTGSGKTVTAAEIIRQVGKTTLWIINRKTLASQTQEVLSELLDMEVGLISEGKVDIKDVTVCTYQTLINKTEKLKEWLNKEVGFVIADEVHGVAAKSVQTIMSYCINTEFRLGLSATFDNRHELFMEIKGLIGPVCYSIDKDDTRRDSFLSKAKITFIELDDKQFADNGEYNDSYNSYIVNNNIRNNKIKDLVEEYKDEKILIITKSVDHARILSNLIDCPLIIGDTTTEERIDILNKYKLNNGFVCIGSIQIMAEGIDLPAISMIIQASAISGWIKTIQVLGRGLRISKGKDRVLYFDFVDKHQRFFRSASRNRQKHLKSEGHSIKVIKTK